MSRPRRSSREIKKPDLYSQSDMLTARSRTVSKGVHEQEEESDEAEVYMAAKSTKKRPRLSVSPPPVATKRLSRGNKVTTDNESDYEMDMFDALLTCTKPNLCASSFIEKYQRDRVSAICALVNMILRASGAGRNCIADDVDLDALDQQEIEQLLSEPIRLLIDTDGSKSYPLIGSQKGKANTRDKFKSFWSVLATLLLATANSNTAPKPFRVDECLRRIIEQCATLSAVSVVNIRDAALEAILSLADGLADVAKESLARKNLCERQLHGKSSRSDERSKALEKQRAGAVKEVKAIVSMLDRIFESVFVHRVKDFSDNLRLHAFMHLPSFLKIPVAENQQLREDNLKYLGFALHDSFALVRERAVELFTELVNDVNVAASLESFLSHFLPRLIAMAAGDCDARVSKASISLMRDLQRQGLLDSVPQEDLDSIDVVVFDVSTDEASRAEALCFFMDHTEGFEEQDDVVLKNKSTSLSARRIAHSGRDEKQRSHGLQLEALSEFIEHHLEIKNMNCGVSLLADALMHAKKQDVLFDWPVMFGLLIRDKEEFITTSLRTAQVTALLELLLAASKIVTRYVEDTSQRQDRDREVWRDRSKQLTQEMQRQLIKMLSRFRDDSHALSLLCELLSIVDVPLHSNTHLSQSLKQLLLSNGNDSLTISIVKVMRKWMSDVIHGGDDFVSAGVVSVWQQFVTSQDAMEHELAEIQRRSSSSSSSSSRRVSDGHVKLQKRLSDASHGLAVSLSKMKILLESFDCRQFLSKKREMPQATTSLMFVTFSQTVKHVRSICSLMTTDCNSSTLRDSIVTCAEASLNAQRTLIVWKFRDYLQLQKAVDANEPGTISAAKELCCFRDELLEECMECITDESDGDVDLHRKIRLAAYRIVNELRALFPVRLQDEYDVSAPLSMTVSTDLLRGLKSVFDEESQSTKEQLQLLDEQERLDVNALAKNPNRRQEVKQRQKEREGISEMLCSSFVNNVLLPLAGSLVFDTKHLNRRQAAAALSFVLSDRDIISKAAQSFARSLREKDPLKFMHVLMLLMKDIFADCVKDEDALATAKERLDSTGRKLSSLLGVRTTGESHQALQEFLMVGCDFALQSAAHSLFFATLIPFLRLIPSNSRGSLMQLVEEQFTSKDGEFLEELEKSPECSAFLTAISPSFANRFFNFHPQSATKPAKSAVKKSLKQRNSSAKTTPKKTTARTSERSQRPSRSRKPVSYLEPDSEIEDFSEEEPRIVGSSSSGKRNGEKDKWAAGLNISDSSDEEDNEHGVVDADDDEISLDEELKRALAMPRKNVIGMSKSSSQTLSQITTSTRKKK